MALDTYVVLANQYDSEGDALADYDAVRKRTLNLGLSIPTMLPSSAASPMGR